MKLIRNLPESMTEVKDADTLLALKLIVGALLVVLAVIHAAASAAAPQR